MSPPTTDPQLSRLATLGQVLATVAHEISNPISFIAGNVAPLRDQLGRIERAAIDAQLPELAALATTALRSLGIIETGTERAVQIARDLHQLSRDPRSGAAPLDLADAVAATLRLLRPRWKDRVRVSTSLEGVPTLRGDVGHLHQILLNLVANAIDAAREHVDVSATVTSGRLVLDVTDDGPGVASSVADRLFEPYVTTKPPGSGTGLGLAITREIVERYGGAIAAGPHDPSGTTFRVTLPIGAAGDLEYRDREAT